MKTRIYLFAMIIMFSCINVSSLSAKEMSKAQTEVRVAQIKDRVNEIKALDIAHLNKTERVSLKHELKGMNKELRSMQPYIYISAGALILIIILILILL